MLFAETGNAERRRSHVDAAPPAAEIERHADDVDSLHGSFTDTDIPSPDGVTIEVTSARIGADRVQEVPHLALLVDDVVGEEQSARRQPRQHQIEKALVIALPRVEEHEVERARQFRDLLERVARHHRDDVGEAGRADVVGGEPRPRGVVLDRRQVAAGLPQAETDPDRAVAVGAADFERALRAARHDHHAKKPAVFLGDGELIAVGCLDLRSSLATSASARGRSPAAQTRTPATAPRPHDATKSACS